jgi:hypothetical protein
MQVAPRISDNLWNPDTSSSSRSSNNNNNNNNNNK